MPISETQGALLNTLGLKEGSELYTLAVLLLETPHDPRNQRGQAKTAWHAAKDAFVRAIAADTQEAGITPIVLFIRLARGMRSPLKLFKIIHRESLKRKPPLNMRLYDPETLFAAMEAAYMEAADQPRFGTNVMNNLDLWLELACPAGITPDAHFTKRLLDALDTLPVNKKYTLQIFMCKPLHRKTNPLQMSILKHLCNNTTLNNGVDVPYYNETLTACECAVKFNNASALILFIPNTTCETRWAALVRAIQTNKERMFTILLNYHSDDLLEKIAQEGQHLLKMYISENSRKPNVKIIEALLNAGCILESYSGILTPEILQTDDFLRSVEIRITKTERFFKMIQENSSLDTLSSILTELENPGMAQPYFNTRNTNGDTLFYSLFDALMRKDITYFNRLIQLIIIKNIKVSFKNNREATIYSHPCLPGDQKKYLTISETLSHIKQTWKQVLSYDSTSNTIPQEELKTKKERLQEILENGRKKIGTLLKTLPHEANIQTNSFYLEGWLLFFVHNENHEMVCLPEASFYTEKVQEMMNGPKDALPLNSICDAFGYNITQKHFLIVDSLLQMNAPVDLLNMDADGNTLLHLIMLANQSNSINLILEKLEQCSHSLALPNKKGDTPLHIACEVHPMINKSQIQILIKAYQKQGKNVDILNGEGFSPLYIAIKQKHTVQALLMVNLPNVSVNHRFPVSILFVCANHITNFAISTDRNVLIKQRELIIQHLHIVEALLNRGCNIPYDEQKLKIFYETLERLGKTLWDTPNNPSISLLGYIKKIYIAWADVENVKKRPQPYSTLKTSWVCINTKRNNRTMFEEILLHKNFLETAPRPSTETPEARQKNIVYFNNILSLLILHGGVFANGIEEKYMVCKKIRDQLERLKRTLEKFVSHPKTEDAPSFEEDVSALYQQVLDNLNALNHQDDTMFKAYCFYYIAKYLFLIDNKKNILLVSAPILKIIQNCIDQAVALTQNLENEDAKEIVEFNAVVSRYFPDRTAYKKLEDILRTCITPQKESQLKREQADRWPAIEMLLSSSWLLEEDKPFSLCTAIPEILERRDEEIEELRKKLEESQTNEKQLRERIMALETQFLPQPPPATEKDKPVEQCTLGSRNPIIYTRQRAEVADEQLTLPQEKRQKKEPYTAAVYTD